MPICQHDGSTVFIIKCIFALFLDATSDKSEGTTWKKTANDYMQQHWNLCGCSHSSSIVFI